MDIPSQRAGHHPHDAGEIPRAIGREPAIEPESEGPALVGDWRGRNAASAQSGGGWGLVWLASSLVLLLAAWFLGPELVARYQYASTRGRISAEYEHASRELATAPLDGVSTAYQLVARKIRPSVVSIIARSRTDPRRPLSGSQSGGQGSGVIMSRDGFIITNEHVIGDAGRVDVMLDDRRHFPARVVGRDALSDLAVLKIDAEGLFPAEWGDSDDLQVGSMVWAVGSPYGLQQTVTSGILSAKERREESSSRSEYLQTDAAINPGNSGGPLVNARGQVVGINTSIYGETFLGISFAVPSSIARFVFDQIVQHGTVTRGFLGIVPREVVHDDMIRNNLPDMNGAVIDEIGPIGPARRTELRPGDIIRHWDGREVKTWNTLYRFIGMSSPNTEVNVAIIRDGEARTVKVPVGDASEFIPD